jgi:hypothetical protein
MSDESSALLHASSSAPRAPQSPVSRLRAPAAACAIALLLGLSLAALSRLASAVSGRLAAPRGAAYAPGLADTRAGAGAGEVAALGEWSFSGARRHERGHPRGRTRAHTADCDSPRFTKDTLVLLAEYRVARLLAGRRQNSGLRTFELSDVVVAPSEDTVATTVGRDGPRGRPSVYAVLDNAFSVLKIDARVDDTPGTPNDLLQWPDDDGAKSEFEAIAYSPRSKSFAIVQEDIVGKKSGRLHAHVLDVSINSTSNEIVRPRSNLRPPLSSFVARWLLSLSSLWFHCLTVTPNGFPVFCADL